MSYPAGSPAGVQPGALITYHSHGTATLLSAATSVVSIMASTPSTAAGHASGNGTASTAAHGASHVKVPDLTTARNMMIAMAGLLILCMIPEITRFITRLSASLSDRSQPKSISPDDIPPVSAMHSATFLTDRAQLLVRRKVGGGGLMSGWFLRKGRPSTGITSPFMSSKEDFSKPAIETPGPYSAMDVSVMGPHPPHFVPPLHSSPFLDYIPFSRHLTFAPFAWLPKPFRSRMKIPHLWLIGLYVAVNLVALLWNAKPLPAVASATAAPDYRRTGTITIVNMPIAIALGVRGNILGLCIGQGYEKLKTFHKIVGRVCFMAATAHVGYFAAKWAMAGDIMAKSLKLRMLMAWVAWSALVLLVLSSLPWIRKRWFTFFEACHAIGIILFIVGTGMHVKVAAPWCIASGAIYLVSIIFTLTKTKIVRAEILALPSSTSTVITIPSIRSGWRAGQHVRIRIPALGMRLGYEGHPFTISSAPETEGLVLMCKINGDWTSALHRLALGGKGALETGVSGSTPTDVTAIVEGPHGGLGNTLLPAFSSVMLVAGGSGITHSLALAHDLLSKSATGVVRARVVDLIWVVRTEDVARPLMPTLLDMVNDAKKFEASCLFNDSHPTQPTGLRVHIYVTRCSPSATIDLGENADRFGPIDGRQQDHDDEKDDRYASASSTNAFNSRVDLPNRMPCTPFTSIPTALRNLPLSCLAAYPTRPDFDHLVNAIVHETVERHARDRTDASGICVTACGPVSMVASVDNAIRKVDGDQRRVIGGIEFEEECFQY